MFRARVARSLTLLALLSGFAALVACAGDDTGNPPEPSEDATDELRRRRRDAGTSTDASTIDAGGSADAAAPTADAGGSTPPPTRSSNCAPSPHACGYPDETNTGITPGKVLRRVPQDVTSGPGWSWDTRGFLRVESAGAVIDGIDVQGEIYITVPRVTIRNAKVTFGGGSSIGISVRPGANDVVIESSRISGANAGAERMMAGIKAWGQTGLQVRRCDITFTSTAIQTDQGLVTDNYVHDMGFLEGDHTNGFTSNAYGGGVVVRHNTIFNQLAQTDAVSFFQDFGVQKDATIDDNLLAGGGYVIYGGGGSKGVTSNIKITNNRIGRQLFPKGGFYGWLAWYDAQGAGNVLGGNVWDDTSAPVQ